jgi:SAM-dependent methyltransferase
VLTDDAFRGSRLDVELRDKFYATGAEAVALIDTVATRCGVAVDPQGVCLEFGCGVGRVTLHLARRFRRVVAVDISAGNLALCREMLAARGVDNVEVVQIGTPEDVRALPHFDFLASTIVFQHNPPPVQHYLLDVLLKKISAFGGFLFQLPTHTPDYSFRADVYLASAMEEMELHSLPMADVLRLFAKHRLQPLEVLMDGWTGVYGSHTFFGVKRP